MTFQYQGIRGRSSRSTLMGIRDPRHRRAPQHETKGEDYALPLYVDRHGRLGVRLGADLSLASNGDLVLADSGLTSRSLAAADYQLDTDRVVLVDTSGGPVTYSLLPAATFVGRLLYVKNLGINTMTVDAHAAETIDGAATAATSTQYATFRLYSDGTEWHLL